jgi:type II secretory pathway pseudopilin PulG
MLKLVEILRRARSERGFTLPELLIAASMGIVVLGGAAMVMMVAARSQPRLTERTADVERGRALIERISRELRQGEAVTNATASQLSIDTYVKSASCGGAAASTSILCRVTYTCSAGVCTRLEQSIGGGGGVAVREVEGLSDTNVFTYTPSAAAASYVGIRLSFGGNGIEAVTLQDGVTLRNPVTSS